jgi:hypothetical protein
MNYTQIPGLLPDYSGMYGGGYGGASAYGYVPQPTTPSSTIGTVGPQAIAAGQAVNNQLPGYNQSVANVGANVQSETAGQLPADVVQQLQYGAAERGMATGSPGSPNANAAYLRSLGLNSLQLTNTGEQNLNAATAALPGQSIAQNPNFYLNPNLQYEAGLQNSIFAAAPNPYAAAMANLGAARGGVAAGGGGSSLISTPAPGTLGAGNPFDPNAAYADSAPVGSTQSFGYGAANPSNTDDDFIDPSLDEQLAAGNSGDPNQGNFLSNLIDRYNPSNTDDDFTDPSLDEQLAAGNSDDGGGGMNSISNPNIMYTGVRGWTYAPIPPTSPGLQAVAYPGSMLNAGWAPGAQTFSQGPTMPASNFTGPMADPSNAQALTPNGWWVGPQLPDAYNDGENDDSDDENDDDSGGDE